MATTMNETADDEDGKKLDSDRRLSEYWLQEALELSLFQRFCTGKGEERALILHAKRHGSWADFALLDAQRKLILVEVKREALGRAAAQKAVEQAVRYARDEGEYRKLTLGEWATWYCKHLVDVNCWFEYRGDYCLVSGKELEQRVKVAKKAKDESQYGRLIRWSPNNIKHYLAGTQNPEEALKVLRKDYKRIVGKALDGVESERLDVGRCIVLAQGWPPEFTPQPTEGLTIELWKYGAPEDWAKPISHEVRSDGD